MNLTPKPILIVLLINTILLSGCLPPMVQGLSTMNSVIALKNDRRSVGEVLDDKTIALKLFAWYNDNKQLTDAHLNFMVYDKTLLITGEVPTATMRSYSSKNAMLQAPKLKRVFSEVIVGQSSGNLSRIKDSAITLQVEAHFQNQDDFHPTHVRVMTENQTIYLMGSVTQLEGSKAAKLAAQAKGVHKVVKFFDYLKKLPIKPSNRS